MSYAYKSNRYNFRMSIGARLKEWRAINSLTQKDASSIFDVSYGVYQKYEYGSSIPGGDAIKAFVREGFNANWLLTGEGEMLLADMQTPQHQDAQSATPLMLDREKIFLAIETVEEGLQITERVMKPNKKAELIMAVYDLLAEQSEQQPPIKKETLLRLVKSAA